eukprot:CAMPEP_0119326206 /NCGR_PEP_ID=MMETSP1333-20130426/67801_1 /TAXON_ID=418940 /ORGANISM="Scyphosphaera apsteinii, Strain RCC1455" /LENGTH=251 /DNA_ID=CAMNT_0007334449 /DNA_START=202 /DNA_END=957 /DNA_ORIENTATION=-
MAELDALWDSWVAEGRAAKQGQLFSSQKEAETGDERSQVAEAGLTEHEIECHSPFLSEASSPVRPAAPCGTAAQAGGGSELHAEYLPPTLLPSSYAEKELKSQAAYIKEIEQLLSDRDLQGAPEGAQTESPGDALSLRRANRMLKAKVWHMQAQLQAAHARCRRSEQINAKWRAQHATLRQREREQWQQLSAALQKSDRVDELNTQVVRLREQLRQRTHQLTASGEHCAELERTIVHLRDMLRDSMRFMRP